MTAPTCTLMYPPPTEELLLHWQKIHFNIINLHFVDVNCFGLESDTEGVMLHENLFVCLRLLLLSTSPPHGPPPHPHRLWTQIDGYRANKTDLHVH